MVQELISKTVAIVGAGPSGCICAKFLSDNGFDVSVFDKGKFLSTILPTGGGKCNLAHSIYDFRELAANYPRGEKFLYSIFSKFGTLDTIDFFKSIGIETYTRDDGKIFPVSNSAADVREKLLKSLKCSLLKEKIIKISSLENGFKIISDKSSYFFDYVVVAIGGHSGFDIIRNLGINIVEPTQSLVGLISEWDFSSIAGVSVKNVGACGFKDDILFTHKGISGPLIYKISSVKAREKLPYSVSFKLIQDFDFQLKLNQNPHKEIKNLLGEFLPRSFCVYILESLGINPDTKCHLINGSVRDKIYSTLMDFKINITGKVPDSEVVTCGGVDLREINPKTLESKRYAGLYFCGEVLDIDGFCGGFNLQNCWSTGFVAANGIIDNL